MMSLDEILHLPALITRRTSLDLHAHPSWFGCALPLEQQPNRIGHLEAHSKNSLSRTCSNRMTILSIGEDRTLLNTRHMVLESAGFLVRSILSIDAIEEAEVLGIDLALICHSVEEDRACAAAHLLKKMSPAISILLLCKGYRGGRITDVEQIAPHGPKQLLLEIERTLQHKLGTCESSTHALQISPATKLYASRFGQMKSEPCTKTYSSM